MLKLLIIVYSMIGAFSANLYSTEFGGSGEGGLRWRDLSVSLPVNNINDEVKFLVEPSSGFVQNGHVTAIIGPSGAGKSTFLAALSSTVRSKNVSGSIWLESPSSDGSQAQKSPLSIS